LFWEEEASADVFWEEEASGFDWDPDEEASDGAAESSGSRNVFRRSVPFSVKG
jgi:hypothetical protein